MFHQICRRARLGLMALAVVTHNIQAQAADWHPLPERLHTDTAEWLAASSAREARYRDGSEWRVLMSVPGDTRILSALRTADGWLVGTSRGLHLIEPDTRREAILFHEPGGIHGLALIDATVYAVSSDSLYRLSGGTLERISRLPQDEFIHKLIPDAPRQRLLVLTDSTLWQWHLPSSRWQALTHNVITEQIGRDALETSVEEDAEISALPFLRDCIVSQTHLYVASERGILQQTPDGEWSRLPTGGLPSRNVTSLAEIRGTLVAATDRGAALWLPEQQHWQRHDVLGHAPVLDLAVFDNKLLAVTDSGLRDADAHPKLDAERLILLNHEPGIRDVQEAAIRYAEVEPEKIARWRRQARWKGVLPTLRFGYDRDSNMYITSRGSTTDSSTDRIISAERPSDGFDITMTWSLDSLIWSSDQTSIDNRSRLSTLLRESVVDQVTRLYFERRRLQLESESQNELDRALRIEELTALIDGLTGGYFSNSLKQKTTRSKQWN